jgi:hypothetical protein
MMRRYSAPEGSGTISTRSINYSQWIKWTVYSLLLVNWGFYAQEEWVNA